MENEKLIKKITIVFGTLMQQLVDRNYKVSKGGATIRTFQTFIENMKKAFGTITNERLVDFCVCSVYAYRNRKSNVKQMFGPASIKRLQDKKRGSYWHEDQWLAAGGLSRIKLLDMIKDKNEHPYAKYIYIAAEETTKKRAHNSDMGFYICQNATLGWSPCSESCDNCVFQEQCKENTKERYPELFRIREEYGAQNS